MFRVRTASLIVLVALILLLGGLFLLRGGPGIAGVPLDTPAFDFRLEAPYRGPVTLTDYQGDAVLLTFARPSCDDCNPQLATLADAVARLDNRRRDLRVLVVSLEPVASDRLLAFVQDHDLGFTGLFGDPAAAREAEAAYRAAESSVVGTDGPAVGGAPRDSIVAAAPLAPVPAGPRIYGIDRNGTLRAVWGPGDPAVLARDIRTLLRYR